MNMEFAKLLMEKRPKDLYHAFCLTTKNSFNKNIVLPGKSFDILTAKQGEPYQKILCLHHHPEPVTKVVKDKFGRPMQTTVKQEQAKDSEDFSEGTKDI